MLKELPITEVVTPCRWVGDTWQVDVVAEEDGEPMNLYLGFTKKEEAEKIKVGSTVHVYRT